MSGQERTWPTRLGYVCIEARSLAAWHRFGEEAIGTHVEVQGNALIFRLDDWSRRLVVTKGPRDDVSSIGWELTDEHALAEMAARLRCMGHAVRLLGRSDVAQRGVEHAMAFENPLELPFEFFVGPRKSNAPLNPGRGIKTFVTGDLGIGHVAAATSDPQRAEEFIRKILSGSRSDRIVLEIPGGELSMDFFHVNQRHHSLALADVSGAPAASGGRSIHHLMLQVAEIKDVILAHERCAALGYRVSAGIGQHSNDGIISFYVVTPSGFELEIGWGGVLVDDEKDWGGQTYDRLSNWGHAPERMRWAGRLSRLGRSVTPSKFWKAASKT